jgi:hypothetical protein
MLYNLLKNFLQQNLMIPRLLLRLLHVIICRCRMNMLVTSQYQHRLSSITNVAPCGSANQTAVFTSN